MLILTVGVCLPNEDAFPLLKQASADHVIPKGADRFHRAPDQMRPSKRDYYAIPEVYRKYYFGATLVRGELWACKNGCDC